MAHLADRDFLSMYAALGAGSDGSGIALVLPQATDALGAATETWPAPGIAYWQQAALRLRDAQKTAAKADSQIAARLYTKPDGQTGRAIAELSRWKTYGRQDACGRQAVAIAGRAIAVAATLGKPINPDLLAALRKLSSPRKDPLAGDWALLAAALGRPDPELQHLLQTLKPGSSARAAAVSIDAALTAVVAIPPAPGRVGQTPPASTQSVPPSSPEGGLSQPGPAEDEDDDSSEAPESRVPQVFQRLAAAEYAPVALKLGIRHRTHLTTSAVRRVVAHLIRALTGTAIRDQGFAALYLVSLLTSTTDAKALDLAFGEPAHGGLWLDGNCNFWAWDFSAYRRYASIAKDAGADRDLDPVEPIRIPLPDVLAETLRQWRLAAPTASTFGELLRSIETEAIALPKSREWLRAIGDPVHPPYKGRWAASLAPAILEITRSDMHAALSTASFAFAAPSSLFYYRPEPQVFLSRINQVYQELGLGDAASMDVVDVGPAGTSVLTREQIRHGWETLRRTIAELQSRQRVADCADNLARVTSALMRYLGAAQVVVSAQRGSRLDRLTHGCLYASTSLIVVGEKADSAGRSVARLLPKTQHMVAVLSALTECRETAARIARRLRIDAAALTSPRQDEATFVAVRVEGGSRLHVEPLATADIASVIAEAFIGARVNAARAVWLTALDEHGCDRWLIRALSGHARDVSRVCGAYIDVPPLVVAQRLGAEMDELGRELFGAPIRHRSTTTDDIVWRPTGALPPPITVDTRVPDPRTVLDTIDESVLVGYRVGRLVRDRLLAGAAGAGSAAGLMLLSLLFIDLHPDANAALAEASEIRPLPIGASQATSWTRAHFVHPAILPLHPLTAALHDLASRDAQRRTTRQVLREAVSIARQCTGVSWPPSDERAWTALAICARALRRIELPPSLATVSAPTVPAPALSERSMRRLAGEHVPAAVDVQSITTRRTRLARRSTDLRQLAQLVQGAARTDRQLGEGKKRAQIVNEGLVDLRERVSWTPYGLRLRNWIQDEIDRAVVGARGCYEVSSLATYLSVLARAPAAYVSLDPLEYDDEQLVSWAHSLHDDTAETMPDSAALRDHVRHAVAALVRHWHRLGLFVPSEFVRWLQTESEGKPYGSASSVLILTEDREAGRTATSEWHRESALSIALSNARWTSSWVGPLRSGEISSLHRECLTADNELVVRTAGFHLHKTANALRLIPLETVACEDLRAARSDIDACLGAEQPLLLRGSGSAAASDLDVAITGDCAAALKLVTGDPQAQWRSIRAAMLQERAWAGWQEAGGRLLAGTLGTHDCASFVRRTFSQWTGLATATVVAGHGDLRSAIGNYLAGWTVVHALVARALAANLKPSHALLRRLGCNPDALRQARHRGRLDNPDALGWSEWDWLDQRPRRETGADAKVAKPASAFGPVPVGSTAKPNCAARIHFGVLRALGVGLRRAMTDAGVSVSHANAFEASMQASSLHQREFLAAIEHTTGRARDATLRLAGGDLGTAAITWIAGLPADTVALLRAAFDRVDGGSVHAAQARSPSSWRNAAQALPPSMAVHLRLGSAYLDGSCAADFEKLRPVVTATRDPRIGGWPVVRFTARDDCKNQVVSARLTTVVRLALLCRTSLCIGE